MRDRLNVETQRAWRFYCALEKVLPYQQQQNSESTGRRKLTASTIPWHGAAAGLTLEFHAEVRRLEVHLREMVTGVRGVRRGGSDQNTDFALRALPKLAEAVDDQTVLGIMSYMDGWIRRADAVFRPEQGLHRLPREPKEKELPCPWCAKPTMRWHPLSGIVVCVNPHCLDDTETRPRWRSDFTVADNVLVFTWVPIQKGAA